MFNSVRLADRGSSKPPASGEGAKDAVGDAVKGTSEDGERTQHAKDDKMEADVTVRDVDSHREEAVAREARKGYDLLFIGIERARAKTGGFHAEVARIASRFEGPQAIVAANGVHLLQPEVSRLRLLVPVNGTLVSRRAAEIAIAVARVLEAPMRLSTSRMQIHTELRNRHVNRAVRGMNRRSSRISSRLRTNTASRSTRWCVPPSDPTRPFSPRLVGAVAT
jgi:hypothetical protein